VFPLYVTQPRFLLSPNCSSQLQLHLLAESEEFLSTTQHELNETRQWQELGTRLVEDIQSNTEHTSELEREYELLVNSLSERERQVIDRQTGESDSEKLSALRSWWDQFATGFAQKEEHTGFPSIVFICLRVCARVSD
jgi:hypothetical protein